MGTTPAIAWEDLAAEVVTEVRLLKAIQAELAVHARDGRRPTGGPMAISWPGPYPGSAKVGGPVLAAAIGRAGRFPLVPSSSPTAGLHRGRARPGTPTAKDNPCPRPARLCWRRRSSAQPIPPQGRSSAREDLLHTDGRTRRQPRQGTVCRGSTPGRVRLGGDGPRHALRRVRHQRRACHRRASQDDHRPAVDRPTRGAGAPPQHQDDEGVVSPPTPARALSRSPAGRRWKRRPEQVGELRGAVVAAIK